MKRCHCDGYWPPSEDERVTTLHGTHTCAVYVERTAGDIEVHAVMDDGAGNLFCTLDDDEMDAAKGLLDEVNKLRDRLAAKDAHVEATLREAGGILFAMCRIGPMSERLETLHGVAIRLLEPGHPTVRDIWRAKHWAEWMEAWGQGEGR